MTNKSRAIHTSKESPFRNARDRFAAGRLGMSLFLVSLAILFAASLVGYAVIRLQLPWPQTLAPLPLVLLLSTLVLIVSSCTLQLAIMKVRVNQLRHVGSLLTATTVLGVLFLVMQSVAWGSWFAAIGDQWPDSQAYRWALASFYVLTGIHALHVIGGIAPLLITTAKALRGRYDAEQHAGIHYCAMYWHFLGVVWVVLYLTLLIGT